MASFAVDTTNPLGVLEPLVPRLLEDVAACGSTLLPGWTSAATTPAPLLLPWPLLSPLKVPPSFFVFPLTLPHSSWRRPLIPRFDLEARKAVSGDSTRFPFQGVIPGPQLYTQPVGGKHFPLSFEHLTKHVVFI